MTRSLIPGHPAEGRLGIAYEERDLVRYLGMPYRKYQQTVPQLFLGLEEGLPEAVQQCFPLGPIKLIVMEQLIRSPYDQEHIDFVTAIRNATPLNEAEFVAVSTMAGIMGRVSAYTGKEVTWDEMMNSELKLGPKVFEMGPVDVSKTVPVPGE